MQPTDPSIQATNETPSGLKDIDLQNIEEDEENTGEKRKFKTVDRSRRRKKKRSEKRKSSNYVKKNLKMISSALFIAGAIGMIIVGAIRFSEMD